MAYRAIKATTSVAGDVQLATGAQAVTGTDPSLVITPSTLTSRLASPGPIGGTTPGAGTFSSIQMLNSGDIAINVTSNTSGNAKVSLGASTVNPILQANRSSGNGELLMTSTTVMSWTPTGNVTLPSQTGFRYAATSTVSGVTGDGTSYTPLFLVSVFNRGSIYNTGTGAATTPSGITGVWDMFLCLCLTGITASNTSGSVSIVAAGTTYVIWKGSPFGAADASGNLTLNLCLRQQIAASQTVTPSFIISGSGTKNVALNGEVACSFSMILRA